MLEETKQQTQEKKKIKKTIFFITGSMALAVGVVGILLPILPTTPFLILASACYLKSFDGLNEKLVNSSFYKKNMAYIIEQRGMKLKAKLAILIPVLFMLSIIFLMLENIIIKIIIVMVAVTKTTVFIRMKTIKEE